MGSSRRVIVGEWKGDAIVDDIQEGYAAATTAQIPSRVVGGRVKQWQKLSGAGSHLNLNRT